MNEDKEEQKDEQNLKVEWMIIDLTNPSSQKLTCIISTNRLIQPGQQYYTISTHNYSRNHIYKINSIETRICYDNRAIYYYKKSSRNKPTDTGSGKRKIQILDQLLTK